MISCVHYRFFVRLSGLALYYSFFTPPIPGGIPCLAFKVWLWLCFDHDEAPWGSCLEMAKCDQMPWGCTLERKISYPLVSNSTGFTCKLDINLDILIFLCCDPGQKLGHCSSYATTLHLAWSKLTSPQGLSAWLGTCWVHRPLGPIAVAWCFALHFPTRNTNSLWKSTRSCKSSPITRAWWTWLFSWTSTPNRKLYLNWVWFNIFYAFVRHSCCYIKTWWTQGPIPWVCLPAPKLGPARSKTACLHRPNSCTRGCGAGLALAGLIPYQVAAQFQWGKAVANEKHDTTGRHVSNRFTKLYRQPHSGGTKVQPSGARCSPKTDCLSSWSLFTTTQKGSTLQQNNCNQFLLEVLDKLGMYMKNSWFQ